MPVQIEYNSIKLSYTIHSELTFVSLFFFFKIWSKCGAFQVDIDTGINNNNDNNNNNNNNNNKKIF